MLTIRPLFEQAEQWIFNPLPKEAGWYLRLLQHTGRILYGVGRDILAGQLTLHAMSLVYTTLLSVVPLLALSFSVLKSLGVHNKLTPYLYQLFEPMGEQGKEVVTNMLGFVENIKVGVLGSVGLAVLIYTVISLVQKVEGSFNFIWRVPSLRSVGQRFSNYLSVILVGPVLVVSAIGVTASIMSSSIVQALINVQPFGHLILRLSELAPFFMMMMAFTFVYAFMPNTKVKLKSALVGGVIGGLCWQLSGLLFASFVVNSTKYAAIYSGFAVGILLLIWCYLSWLILLLGASISYYDQNAHKLTPSRDISPSAELDEHLAMQIMFRVAACFDKGLSPENQETIDKHLCSPPEQSNRVIKKLLKHDLLRLVDDQNEDLVPARSLDQISVWDVLSAVRSDDDQLIARMPRNEALLHFWLEIQADYANKLAEVNLLKLVRHDKSTSE